MGTIDYQRQPSHHAGEQGELRPDLDAAIRRLPPDVAAQVLGPARDCLDLVNARLSRTERIELLVSAAVNWFKSPINSVLVLTDRRLLFVAPAPQVLAWRLPTITHVQALKGASGSVAGFHVHAGGGEFQLGVDGGWGPAFEDRVKQAVAAAVLADA